MILSAQSIRMRHGMIRPFNERTEETIGDIMTTHGLSSCGYDVRLNTAPYNGFMLAPGEFRLAVTKERFNIPDDIYAEVKDKSSLARRGISVFNTCLEPGWRGYLTLEIVNHSGRDLYLPDGIGIAQVVFHRLDYSTKQPYTGKYQDQGPNPQPPI